MATKTWFSVEIWYDNRGELKRFYFMNCNGQTVHKLRFQIINEGLQLPVDANTWVVIFPWVVKSFTATRQKSFFYEAHSDLNKTVFSQDQKVQQ